MAEGRSQVETVGGVKRFKKTLNLEPFWSWSEDSEVGHLVRAWGCSWKLPWGLRR